LSFTCNSAAPALVSVAVASSVRVRVPPSATPGGLSLPLARRTCFTASASSSDELLELSLSLSLLLLLLLLLLL